MTVDRYSIKNSLRQVRGARASAGRATQRYGRRDTIAAHVRAAMKRLTQAEDELREALKLAWAAGPVQTRRAA
jgi:hypothetical protein